MNIKLAAAAAVVCLGAAACDQGDRQVADNAASERADAGAGDLSRNDGAAIPPAAGRPTPNSANDTPTPGAQPDDDNVGQSEAANAVQDAAAGITGQVNAAVVGGGTEASLRNAALGDMYEIEAGRIALDRSETPVIREIAQAIMDDHREMSAELKTASREATVTFMPPMALDERRQGLIDNLEAASADDFDEVFLDQQEGAHEEALILLRAYADRGDAPELQAAARTAIPTVEGHLADIRSAQEATED